MAFAAASWRESYGLEGGEPNADSAQSSKSRETEIMEGGTSFSFVTDSIEAALEHARAVAGDKDVALAGGASVVQRGAPAP